MRSMNSMKVTTWLAGGAVLACAAQANALNINTYNEADANQVTIRVSGATAHDPGLERLWQLNVANLGICADGTLDFFRAADNLKRLAYCTGAAGLPAALAGRRLAIHKASTGGSGNGVGPLVRPAITVPFWNVPTGGGFLTGCAGAAQGASGVFSAYTLHAGCANTPTNTPAPQAGISDLEPEIFKTAFAPTLSLVELAAIPPNGISAVIMGVPVTLNIRNRMQAMQFGAGDPCIGAETPACQPSLTRNQLAALYSGNYPAWSLIGSPTTAGVDLTNVAGGGPALTSPDVFWCRRVGTSGTQATFETYMLGQRCVDGVPPFVTAAGDPVHVSEGSSNSNVVSCLNTRFSEGRGAIGTLSVEFVPGGADNFRFIKVQQHAPCLLEVVKSKYDFVAESTMQWRTAAIAGLPILGGNPLILAQQIRTKMGNRGIIQDLNTAFNHPFCAGLGSGALVGNALTNTPATTPFVVGGGGTNDVVVFPTLTKTRGLNGPNSCGPMIDIHPTQLAP